MFELYLDTLQVSVWCMAIVFLISGLDELLFDSAFVAWKIYYRFVLLRGRQRLRLSTLQAKEEQPVAIMIPAWKESAVIAGTLRNAIREIDYESYVIFVGVYPNDTETHDAVLSVIKEFPSRIRIALVSHDGPTTKSDCLNAIVSASKVWEKEINKQVEIYVLHDAEDLVPRYGLKVFNYLMPRKAVVQLPVFPMIVPWYFFTEGHYLDEFAQVHVKDMRVREWLTGGVPSAGVGTGFSRGALELVWNDEVGGSFREDLLTEDYEISMQLLRCGASSAFFDGIVRDGDLPIPSMRLWSLAGMPAVRGRFPDKFWASVRQKTRWTLGITLQGWEDLGWSGTFFQKYMYFRDRKPIFTNIANVGIYLLLLFWLIPSLIDALFFSGTLMPPLYEEGSLLEKIIMINLAILVVFMFVRAACTWVVFGPTQAILSLPRLIWANVINFMACIRALKQFTIARMRGQKRIAWEKTEHSAHPEVTPP